MVNITIYFKEYYFRYDLNQIIDKLMTKYFILIAKDNEQVIQNLNNTDILILNKYTKDMFELIYNVNADFFHHKKIIFLRDDLSWDFINVYCGGTRLLDEKSIYIKNLYFPLPRMWFNKNGTEISYPHTYKMPHIVKLHSYGNIEVMPIITPSKIPKLSKESFFKKYNLDANKEIFTIFLTWPKTFSRKNQKARLLYPNCKIEPYFFERPKLVDSIITSLQKKFNVVFKPHPFDRSMRFNPFDEGDVYIGSVYDKYTLIPLSLMKDNYLHKYTFIECEDVHDINIYTKMGMILSRSTFSYHNYLFDIPLLHVDNDNQINNFMKTALGDKNDFKKIVYGSYTTIQLLEENTENILNDFIKEYNIDKLQSKNKSLSTTEVKEEQTTEVKEEQTTEVKEEQITEVKEEQTTEGFEYKHDHLLYGDSYDLNVDAWCDYIDRVINKPINNPNRNPNPNSRLVTPT